MARNKYPEETVERILDAAQRLFLEKGYDQTTIQDIVDQLGGLTKGAVYHHFKSKEEIMDAVGDRMFLQNNPFEAVRRRTDLNGLQKLREAIRINQTDSAASSMTVQSIPITRNPRILAEMIESNRRTLTPYYLELLEEGNRDGSLHTDYPRELAELIPLLTSLWLPCLEKNLALSSIYMHISSSRWPQPSPIRRLVRRQEQGPTEMAQALSIMCSTSS